MIPVGGFYTIDAKGAKAIIEQTRPKCVILMHYKTEHCAYPIAGVEPFLGAMGAENAKPVRTLSVMPGKCARGRCGDGKRRRNFKKYNKNRLFLRLREKACFANSC